MDETEVRFSGRLLGIQKLVDVGTKCVEVVTHFYDKASEVLDHIGDVLGDGSDALKAYALMKVHEHKFETDSNYATLKKKVAIQELRYKQSDLDRSRTRLEREIKELRAKRDKMAKEIYAPGVKETLKDGTSEVVDKPIKKNAAPRERKPLTHHMDIPAAVLEARVETPVSAASP